MSGSFDVLSSAIKSIEARSNYDSDQVNKAISELRKKEAFASNVYDLNHAKTLGSQALERLRVFHEYCVFHFIIQRNYSEFEKYFFRTKYFYDDLEQVIGSQSQNYDTIISLYLLYLLSFNRLADFHLFLSQIPVSKHSHPFYSYSITLERDITIGNYLTQNHSKPPSVYFEVFYDRIFDTIRYESIESSVESVLIRDMVRLLSLDSAKSFEDALIKERENSELRGFKWTIEGDHVRITKLTKIEKNINADEVIEKMITLAHELETIN